MSFESADVRWVLLGVGLGALLLALGLGLLIRFVRRRWQRGRKALVELRQEAHAMELGMEKNVHSEVEDLAPPASR